MATRYEQDKETLAALPIKYPNVAGLAGTLGSLVASATPMLHGFGLQGQAFKAGLGVKNYFTKDTPTPALPDKKGAGPVNKDKVIVPPALGKAPLFTNLNTEGMTQVQPGVFSNTSLNEARSALSAPISGPMQAARRTDGQPGMFAQGPSTPSKGPSALGAGGASEVSELERVQDKYGDTGVDRRMAGKTFDIGAPFRPSGYGGLAALAYKNRMEDRDYKYEQQAAKTLLDERTLANQERQTDITGKHYSALEKQNAADSPLKAAQAKYYGALADAQPDKSEVAKEKNILHFRELLSKIDPDANPAQYKLVADQLMLLDPSMKYDPGKAGIKAKDNWGWWNDVEAQEAVPPRWVSALPVK